MPTKKKHKIESTAGGASGGRPLVARGKGGRFMKMSASGQPMGDTPHTDIVLSKHAHQSHHKAEARPITLQSNAKPSVVKQQKKHGFSFPVALLQVRDRVYSQSKIVRPVHKPKAKAQAATKPVSVFASAVSPYVLDLKHRRTVVHHVLPSLAAAPRRAKHVPGAHPQKQGVLSLFEDQGTSGLPLRAHIRSLLRRPNKQINLTPRPESLTVAARLRRVMGALAWQWVRFSRTVNAPWLSWRWRRMQRPLELQWGNTLVQPAALVSTETRAGRPIASRHVHPLLRLRQSLNLAAKPAPASLSALDESVAPVSAYTPRFTRAWARATMPFAAVCAVFVLAVVAVSSYQQVRDYRLQVLGATDLALRELNEATGNAQSFEFLPAAGEFAQAAQSFKAAAAVINNQASTSAKILTALPGVKGQVDTANDLLKAGGQLSEAARAVSEGVAVFTDTDHFLATQPLTYKLEYFFVRLHEAQPILEESAAILSAIDLAAVPESAREQVKSLAERLPAVSEELARVTSLQDPLLAFLGHGHLQRHLIMFQNNTELRASGGFLGSFALLDMDRGEIRDIEIPGGGPYDMQGSLLEYTQAPRALQLINARWEFQDANWFLDWPTSANTIATFYDRAGGPSVDGVVAVDTQVLERLLAVVGPVKLPGYGVEITAESFRAVLQQQVEVDYNRTENKPKKIIGDLAPVLLAKIKALPVSQTFELASALSSLLQERHVMVFHDNAEVQAGFTALGWGGEVVQTAGDYLAVVNTNIAGGKTDGVVKDSYDLRIHIDEKLQSTHTLTIRREHTGKKGVAFSGVRNVDYLRVYVPAGSTLVSATASNVPAESLFDQPDPTWKVDPALAASEGTYRIDPASQTEMYQESGKTVFAQWVQVDPGHTEEITLVYKIPQAIHTYDVPQRDASWMDWLTNEPVLPPQRLRVYSLYWQKQPGAWDPSAVVSVDYPQTWQVQSEAAVQQGPGAWQTAFEQKQDSTLQLVFY